MTAAGAAPPASVLLVGFMASGKSTVGRLLAQRTGWRLVDVDGEIEARTGTPIAQLFRERGEEWFREEEAQVTRRALDLPGAVVVPGGGWAAREGRLQELPPYVLSVWLKVPAAEVVRRASGEPGKRPLLEGVGAPEAAVARLLRQREPGYARAALHLDTEGRSPLELADEILEHLRRSAPPAEPNTSE